MFTIEIAEKLQKEHRAVLKLIKDNRLLFLKLGELKEFKIQSKGRPTIYFDLNLEQIRFFINKVSATTDLKNAYDIFGIENNIQIVEVRHEIELKRIIESIVKGFSNTSILDLKLETQYAVGKNRLDMCILSEIDGWFPIVGIEIDEELTHKYTKEKDKSRIEKIKMQLDKFSDEHDVQKCKFVIINTNNIYKGIQEIIEILNSDFLNVE